MLTERVIPKLMDVLNRPKQISDKRSNVGYSWLTTPSISPAIYLFLSDVYTLFTDCHMEASTKTATWVHGEIFAMRATYILHIESEFI